MTFIKKLLIAVAVICSVKIVLLLFLPTRNSFASDFTPPSPILVSARLSNSFSNTNYFASIDIEVEKFLKHRNIVGASIAVAKDGKLVMAKGYGYSDREQLLPVEPFNLFRVASVSKLVTAVGIMKLCEEGKLSLEAKVFGPTGILNDSIYSDYIDNRIEQVTVFNLLNHSGGWNNRYGDPSFMPEYIASQLNIPQPITDTDIIRFMMHKRLHFTPGSASSYSNFGYQILGKVIEKASGKNYEDYIKAHVLFPIGIFDMKLGRSYLEEKDQLEVKYYESGGMDLVSDYCDPKKMVSRCYGGNDIHTLGSAGGWIASSTDLLKLILSIDGNNYPSDILDTASIQKMVTPLAANFGPLGWRGIAKDGSWYRTGTLAGTSAILEHRADGVSYVLIVNTSTYKGPELAYELQRVVDRGVNGVSEWPSIDLFELDKASKTPIKMMDLHQVIDNSASIQE